MTKRIILAMMLMGVFASCSNEQIDRELIVADMANPEQISLDLDSLEFNEYVLTSSENPIAYVVGPNIATKTATHPLITYPPYATSCTLVCTITYEYYTV